MTRIEFASRALLAKYEPTATWEHLTDARKAEYAGIVREVLMAIREKSNLTGDIAFITDMEHDRRVDLIWPATVDALLKEKEV